MRLFLLILLLPLIGNGQTYRFASTGFTATKYDLVYDAKEWKFDAGAPVRSTPLIVNNNVYIGTSKGEMLCLNKKTGQVKWKFNTGYAINSSAATQNGRIFFSDNEQTVYALDANSGKLIWKFRMAQKLVYPWAFDYFYSSPALYQDKLMIGGDDGYVYQLNQQNGKLIWKYKCKGIVRSTGAIYKNTVLYGDMEATLYALNIQTGKEAWRYLTSADTMKDDDYGFDRRAIISSVVISDGKAVFGSREGFLYCVNADNGSFQWKVDHEVSWIVSTVAIKDSFVITGTSDGRFVQAINLYTGKEIWKHRTQLAVWSSPLINNENVYAGGYDGQLLCLDLKTGKSISNFCTTGIIYSSPIINDSLLYVGSDDGNLYALRGHIKQEPEVSKLFIYADKQPPMYFRGGSTDRIRSYLSNNGFKSIEADTLSAILSDAPNARNTAIVIAASYIPNKYSEGGSRSLLREFLDEGGRIVLTGNNPLFFAFNDTTKQATALNFIKAAEVFGIEFGPDDTRAFGGLYPSFATKEGRRLNLPDHWVSNFGYDPAKVDIVLGKNENGLATAFVKNYPNGGKLVQIWTHQDVPMNLDAIIKAATWRFN